MQTKRVPYTFTRSGYFYFSRRVPTDLVNHYRYQRVVQALNTKMPSVAKTRAQMLSAKLDAHWSHMRLAHAELPGRRLLRSGSDALLPVTASAVAQSSIGLKEAVDTYLHLRGAGRSKTFHSAVHRSCGYLIDACGLKQLHEYTRKDALAFRDNLIAKGLAGSSITRIFNTVLAVFNFVISEHALEIKNPFTRVYHDRTAGVSKREPIPVSAIHKMQQLCMEKDDEARWLIALVSDTGLRLAEAVGLLAADIKLETDVPHIVVKPNSLRRLKTNGSERCVPLVGASLWAAQRAIANGCLPDKPIFPRYNKGGKANANSASAALNKWIKPYVPAGCTMHSFRHSIRDRLRACGCPTEMVDQIGGWAPDSVGQNYGSGYSLDQMYQSMKAIEL